MVNEGKGNGRDTCPLRRLQTWPKLMTTTVTESQMEWDALKGIHDTPIKNMKERVVNQQGALWLNKH